MLASVAHGHDFATMPEWRSEVLSKGKLAGLGSIPVNGEKPPSATNVHSKIGEWAGAELSYVA